MSALHDARLELHYATRLLASTAHSMRPHADDDSHTALTLGLDRVSLETQPLDPDGLTLALVMPALALEWRLGSHVTTATALAGMRMQDGHDWLNQTRPSEAPRIDVRSFPDFPEHALAEEGRFTAQEPVARAQLAAEYSTAEQALADALLGASQASPLRVWPHHFDLGALVPLGGAEQTIGLGFSPGDESYDEPYYYVSPYPQPEPAALPEWTGPGHWHTQGFVSLVLTASERDVHDARGGGVSDAVNSYLREALQMARALIE